MVNTGRRGRATRAPLVWRGLGVVLWLALPLVACGKSDESDIARSSKAGTGAEAGDSGQPSGGTATGGTATGGTATGGATAEMPCQKGDVDCDGNTPRECNNRGEWVPKEPCGGEKKVCSKGECFAYRLTNAGIDTFGVRPAEGDIVLKEQTLSATPKVCSKTSGICVTGGVR